MSRLLARGPRRELALMESTRFLPLVLAVGAEPGFGPWRERKSERVERDEGGFSGGALEGDFGCSALGAVGLSVGRGLAAVVDDFGDG